MISALCSGCGLAYLVDGAGRGPCPACGHVAAVDTRPATADAEPANEDDVAALAPGARFLDDFVVERELGRGGMGLVTLVRSASTGALFAVKSARLPTAAARHAFLREIQVWIDLPRHPHFVACRFFRSTARGVFVFADYVAGGSLADWIRDGRLGGGAQQLDAAIQFAWALQAAHDLGVVHQDVKPGNVLVTPEGLLKLGDFGLAAARATTDPRWAGKGWGTPAYCSPEQASGAPPTVAADVWSWGVSLLEMFAGEVFWRTGAAAPDVLEHWGDLPRVRSLGMLSHALAAVLERCFARDPVRRWRRIEDAAAALVAIYDRHAPRAGGKASGGYARRRWTTESWCKRSPPVLARVTLSGQRWDHPTEWCPRLGLSPDALASSAAAPPRSLRGAALADLVGYDQLVTLSRPRPELAARLNLHKGRAHFVAGDPDGALLAFRETLRSCEALGAGDADAARETVLALLESAEVHLSRGDARAASPLCQRAVGLLEGGAVNRPDPTLLARALACRAGALRRVKLVAPARDLAVRAGHVAAFAASAGADDAAVETGRALVEQARAELELGEFRRARRTAQRAAKVLRAPARRNVVAALVLLAEANDGLASATREVAPKLRLRDRAAQASALVFHDRALALLQRLIHLEHRPDLGAALAESLANRALTVAQLGEKADALLLLERAESRLLELVVSEGRRELIARIAALRELRQRVAAPSWGVKPTNWVVLPHMARALLGWDPRAVVQRVRLRRGGWVADFCPVCRDFRPFRVSRRLASRGVASFWYFVLVLLGWPLALGLVSRLTAGMSSATSVFFWLAALAALVMLSRAPADVIAYRVTCRLCRAARDDAAPADYRAVVRRRPQTFEELVERTRPSLLADYADRLETEENVSVGSLPPQVRRVLLEEPFLHMEGVLSPRVRSAIPWLARTVGWGCLSSVLGAAIVAAALVLLVQLTPDKRNPLPWLDRLLARTIFWIGPLCLAGFWLYRTVKQRVLVERDLLAALARSLAPLRPGSEEIDGLLKRLRKGGLTIALRVDGQRLLRMLGRLAHAGPAPREPAS